MLERNKEAVITICLFVLAFVMRLLLISKGPFYPDALELALTAERTLDTLTLHYMHAPGSPLLVVVASIMLFLMKSIGVHDSVFSVNFMSVIFGSLSIGIFYMLSRKILDRPGALASSLILCFLPLHIYISTIGLNHSVSILFNLIGIYFLFICLERHKLDRLILSSIFLGFGAAARLTDGLILIAVIFLYLASSFENNKLSKTIIFKRLSLFVCTYGGIIVLFYLPMFFTGEFAQLKSSAGGLYYLHNSPKMLLISIREILIILGMPGVLLAIAGTGYFFIEKDRVLFYFLLIWFVCLFVYYGSLSIVVSRYLLLSLMAVLIMQGYFISKFRKRIFAYCLIFILVVLNFFRFYPVIYFRHRNSLQEDFAKFVESKTEPDSYIVAVDEGLFIEYYANRKVLGRAVGYKKDEFDKFFERVDMLLDKDSPVYIISTGIYGYDPEKYFINTLKGNYNLRIIGRHKNQYWHESVMYKKSVFLESLYRLEKK